MAELKPGWMDRQFARIESEISIMPTFLLPPEMQEQRKKMIKAEIIKAMIPLSEDDAKILHVTLNEKADKEARLTKGLKYTPLYIRQKDRKRFFDEESS